MYEYIKGNIIEKDAAKLVIENGGVGYTAIVSINSLEALPPPGKEARLYCHLAVKEDSFDLYGFADKAEREMFRTLISIPKIGPKTAIGILSAATVRDLLEIFYSGDAKSLSRLPGIGSKTAERLILEMRGKAKKELEKAGEKADPRKLILKEETLAALSALGYQKSVAEKAYKEAELELSKAGEELSVEKLIKKALSIIMKRS